MPSISAFKRKFSFRNYLQFDTLLQTFGWKSNYYLKFNNDKDIDIKVEREKFEYIVNDLLLKNSGWYLVPSLIEYKIKRFKFSSVVVFVLKRRNYLTKPMHKKHSTKFIWSYPFSTHISHNQLFNSPNPVCTCAHFGWPYLHSPSYVPT